MNNYIFTSFLLSLGLLAISCDSPSDSESTTKESKINSETTDDDSIRHMSRDEKDQLTYLLHNNVANIKEGQPQQIKLFLDFGGQQKAYVITPHLDPKKWTLKDVNPSSKAPLILPVRFIKFSKIKRAHGQNFFDAYFFDESLVGRDNGISSFNFNNYVRTKSAQLKWEEKFPGLIKTEQIDAQGNFI